MKRLLCLSIAATLMLGASMGVAAAPSISSHVAVSGYDNNVDYMAEMMSCLNDGSDYAFEIGRIYEQQRNMKIEQPLNLPLRAIQKMTSTGSLGLYMQKLAAIGSPTGCNRL